MKRGLVLEGGAMRGLFTAGVMDVFMENNIEFEGCVGVSAGAAFGCNYKSRQIGRVVRYTKRFCNYWKFCSFRSWLVTGDVFGAEFCYYELPAKHDIFDEEAFRNTPWNSSLSLPMLIRVKPSITRWTIATGQTWSGSGRLHPSPSYQGSLRSAIRHIWTAE